MIEQLSHESDTVSCFNSFILHTNPVLLRERILFFVSFVWSCLSYFRLLDWYSNRLAMASFFASYMQCWRSNGACSGLLSNAWVAVSFLDPPTLEKRAKGICLGNLQRLDFAGGRRRWWELNHHHKCRKIVQNRLCNYQKFLTGCILQPMSNLLFSKYP